MKKVIDIFRFVVISPEVAVVLICILVSTFYPSMLTPIYTSIYKQTEVNFTLLLALIAGFLGPCIAFSQNILFPKDNNKVLLKWPLYNQLFNRIIFSIIWCTASALIIIGLAFYNNINIVLGGFLITSLAISSYLNVFTLIIAYFTVRSLIESNQESDSN